MASLEQSLAAHLSGQLGAKTLGRHLGQPSLLTVLPAFSVLIAPPNDERRFWAFVSCGGSLVGSDEGTPMEFMVLAASNSPDAITLLEMVCLRHATIRPCIQLGQILDIGRPWLPNSGMTYLLVSLPYPLGPQFEVFETDRGPARIQWLLPLWEQEAVFARSFGVDRLEDLLEQAGIDFLDPRRPSVVD